MPNWLLEEPIIWNYRSRSLNILTLGLVTHFFILALADWLVADFTFTGLMKGLESFVKG